MKPGSFQRLTELAASLLIIIVLWYPLRMVDLTLIHYWQQTVPNPWGEYLSHPGGISEGISVFFIRLMNSGTRGIISVILLILLVFGAFNLIFRNRKNHPVTLPLLVAVLIPFTLLFTYYRLPMSITISIVAGYLMAVIPFIITDGNRWINQLLMLVLGILSYWIAGLAGLAVMLQALVIRAVSYRRYRSLYLLVFFFSIPLLSLLLYPGISLKQAYMGLFSVDQYDVVPAPVFISIGMLGFLYLVFQTGSLLKWKAPAEKKWIPVAGLLLIFPTLFFSVRAGIHTTERFGYRILDAGMNKNWDLVLDLCKPGYKLNSLLQSEVNHALWQKGELLERMFSYTQEFGEEGMFPELFRTSRISLQACGFYEDLGFANEVRHWATEAEMGLMHHPVVLENLIMSYAAKGMYDISEKYLRILNRSGQYRDWCGNISEMIERGTIQQHPAVQKYLENNPKVDFFASARLPAQKLSLFYLNNPDNRLAFEYLMAYALVEKDLDYILDGMGDFKRLGYEKLPKHIQEAVCVYVSETRRRYVRLEGYGLDPKVMEDFKTFSQGLSAQANQREKMKSAALFADTYWYYYHFRGEDGQGH